MKQYHRCVYKGKRNNIEKGFCTVNGFNGGLGRCSVYKGGFAI